MAPQIVRIMLLACLPRQVWNFTDCRFQESKTYMLLGIDWIDWTVIGLWHQMLVGLRTDLKV